MLTVLVYTILLHHPFVSSRLFLQNAYTIESLSVLLFVLATCFWSPRSPFVILNSICTGGEVEGRWKAVQGQHLPEWSLDSTVRVDVRIIELVRNHHSSYLIGRIPLIWPVTRLWHETFDTFPCIHCFLLPFTKLILTPPPYSRVLPEQLLSFCKS